MPRIRSIKGARGYGRRKKIFGYLATQTSETVWQFGRFDRYNYPGNIRNNYLGWSGGVIYMFGEVPVIQYSYSCPLGGTYDANSGLCI